MKVVLKGGQTLHIRWKHDFLKKMKIEIVERDKEGNLALNDDGSVKTEILHFCEPKNRNKRFTRCYIYLGEKVSQDTLISESVVKCHKMDEYNKCEGRIRSLTLALSYINEGPDLTIILERADREQIWNQYFKQTRCSTSLKKMVELKETETMVNEPDFTL